MTASFYYALLLGAMGSLHCMGMCGPLALSLPMRGNNDFSKFLGGLVYNSGRIVTYFMIGLLAGSVGYSFSFFGAQQVFSILAGVAILLLLIVKKGKLLHGDFIASDNFLFSGIRKAMSKWYHKSGYGSLWVFGMLNGFLPCGLVYMALTGSLVMGQPLKGGIFMSFFGAGTLPVMWAVTFFGHRLNSGIRLRLQKIYPFLLGAMACLLIIRGLGLDIPYLSPTATSHLKHAVSCD